MLNDLKLNDLKLAPFPWRLDDNPGAEEDGHLYIEDANGNDVATTEVTSVAGSDEDHAKFIVMACNSYPRFIALCTRVICGERRVRIEAAREIRALLKELGEV